jgi:tetratricopeptide (TPR) repeat protein
MAPRVSLTMIVKNEEANLPGCLASVADLVHEIIVVDTGSTDATKEVAARFGARVFDFPWIDDFAAARNEALRHATCDWILWLDADDRIDEPNRQMLRQLFAGLPDQNIAFALRCISYASSEAGSATEVEHVRLFRRHPQIRWQGRIHEQILPAVERLGGAQWSANAAIHHFGYQDPVQRRRKLERDLRLLQIENAEHPDDPLTLFHLGWTWNLLGNPHQALPILGRFLQVAPPSMAVVRKGYILVVRCLRDLGDRDQALTFAQAGLSVFPGDDELCFHQGQILKERGDFAAAEACLRQLLEGPASPYNAVGDDPGLRGYKGRCALAEVYRDSGRLAESEAQYRLVLAEQPDFIVAWMCLSDVITSQGKWDAAEAVARQLEARPGGALTATLLRARAHMFRKDFATARQLAEAAIAQAPQAVWPREVLSHVLVLEGRDWAAAERALRDLLAIQPSNPTALQNLAVAQRELARGQGH